MNWTCGDTHFLLSDNTNHLCSGYHAHPGGQTMRKQIKESQAQQEEALLMQIVKEYVKYTI